MKPKLKNWSAGALPGANHGVVSSMRRIDLAQSGIAKLSASQPAPDAYPCEDIRQLPKARSRGEFRAWLRID
jgi:hypothetical protein